MHHVICGISSLLHSVNLILFTLLLVHLILRISPHHSHQSPSFSPSVCHSLSLSLQISLSLSFTNPFIQSFLFLPDYLHRSWTCTELSGHWRLFVLVSFWHDSLTQSGTGCFIAVPIRQQWNVKGLNLFSKSSKLGSLYQNFVHILHRLTEDLNWNANATHLEPFVSKPVMHIVVISATCYKSWHFIITTASGLCRCEIFGVLHSMYME